MIFSQKQVENPWAQYYIKPKMYKIQRDNYCFHNLLNKKVVIFLQNQVENPWAQYYIKAKNQVALTNNFI